MFALDVLPAEQGDCLWLSWGSPARHLLIDGGPPDEGVAVALADTMATKLTGRGARLELLVVTHIDADHIGGVLDLLRQRRLPRIADVWFNGRHHHDETDVLGAVQAEEVSKLLLERKLPWNAKPWKSGPVVVPDDPSAPLPTRDLPGGLRLTVLGPTRERLRHLVPVWEKEIAKAEGRRRERPAEPPDVLGDVLPHVPTLAARRFVRDSSRANGASITLLAEHDGRSMLLTGDAHGDDVATALDRLAAERGERVAVDVCKLPHHGSRANVSTRFAETVRADHWVFSTSGRQFRHPDHEAVARVLLSPGAKTLHFNYDANTTALWKDRGLRRNYRYDVVFPPRGEAGLRVSL